MRKASLLFMLLTTGLSLVLCGCGSPMQMLSNEKRIAKETVRDSMHVDDLWTVTNYIERTTEELHVPENCICFLKDKPYMVCVDGELFGGKANGTLNLSDDYLILSANFFTKEVSYDEILAHFTAMYGEPVARGEDPNVEINGGAAVWHRFNTGKYIVTLSMAGGYDYIKFEIRIYQTEVKNKL